MEEYNLPRNNTVFWIETGKIKPNSAQPRREFEEEALRELADSIKQYGILQPLLVIRKEEEIESGSIVEYELIAGERRLRAAKLAGLAQVPIIIRKDAPEKIKLELALIENVQRADLNPIERGFAFKRLYQEFKLKQDEIAARVGKSRVYVTNTMRLLNLPEEMRTAISQGKITEGHGRTLLMLSKKTEDQQALYKDIIEKNISVRTAEKLSKRIAFDKTGSEQIILLNQEAREMEYKLANILNARVMIDKDKKKDSGKILIDFSSVDHLKSILARFSEMENEENKPVAGNSTQFAEKPAQQNEIYQTETPQNKDPEQSENFENSPENKETNETEVGEEFKIALSSVSAVQDENISSELNEQENGTVTKNNLSGREETTIEI